MFEPKDNSVYENNKYIKMAAYNAGHTNSVDDKFDLLRVLHKRIAEDGEVPMSMIDVNNTFGRVDPQDIIFGRTVTLEEELRLRMDTVVGEDGLEWYPLYTDEEELNRKPTTNITMNVAIKQILQAALGNDKVSGVVINPFAEKMILSKQAVEIILAEWEGDKEE